MFRIRIQSGQWIRSGFGIRIRIQEGKNNPQKYKKKQETSFFEVLGVLLFLQLGRPLSTTRDK